MKRILNRNEYLDLNRSKSINEVFVNDVAWGDSILGRLINSMIRKAGIGIDLKKMDNVIKRLRNQFDILKDQIKIKKDSGTNIKIFYLLVSGLLGELTKEIEDDSNSEQDVISAVNSISYEIKNSIQVEDESTEKEKEIILKKLEEFSEFLESSLGETSDENEDSDSEESQEVLPNEEEFKKIYLEIEKVLSDNSIVSGTEVKKVIPLALPSGQSVKSLDQINADPNMKNILSIDASKIPNEELQGTLTKIDNCVKILHNSLIGQTEPTSNNSSAPNDLEIKKLFRDLSLKVHPDRITISGLTEETAKTYSQRLNELNKSNDLEGMKKFSTFIDLVLENINIRKSVVDKLEEISNEEIVKKLKKGNSKWLEKKLKDEKYKKYWSKIQEILDGRKSKGETETSLVKRESILIRDYQRFILEKQETRRLKEKFDSIFDEEFMKKYQVTKNPAELEKEFEAKEDSITIDPIIEILKIFNRAYKLHTPGVIPSGRKSGKVSNKVFREYEFVGKGSDTARMAQDGGVEPGIGPFRNKSLFNKWENAVLDIIKNTKYQQIFNENTYFQFSPSDPRYNKQDGKKEGGGKALLKFMTSLLDGSELYREGAQSKFIQEYFDVEVKEEKLGYGSSERKEVSDTANNFKETTKVKFSGGSGKSDLKKGVLYKLIAKSSESFDGRDLAFFGVLKSDNDNIWGVFSTEFAYDKTNIKIMGNIPNVTSDDYSIYKINKSDFFNNTLNGDSISTNGKKQDIKVSFSKFEILKNSKDDTPFTDIKFRTKSGKSSQDLKFDELLMKLT